MYAKGTQQAGPGSQSGEWGVVLGRQLILFRINYFLKRAISKVRIEPALVVGRAGRRANVFEERLRDHSVHAL